MTNKKYHADEKPKPKPKAKVKKYKPKAYKTTELRQLRQMRTLGAEALLQGRQPIYDIIEVIKYK
jgi:hypothetical protein